MSEKHFLSLSLDIHTCLNRRGDAVRPGLRPLGNCFSGIMTELSLRLLSPFKILSQRGMIYMYHSMRHRCHEEKEENTSGLSNSGHGAVTAVGQSGGRGWRDVEIKTSVFNRLNLR